MFFEAESHHVALAGLILPLPPECRVEIVISRTPMLVFAFFLERLHDEGKYPDGWMGEGFKEPRP